MPVPVATSPPVRTLLRESVYETLSAAIVDGTLQPGERVRDADVASWLGASRTPVREALARLEYEGLVETAPNRYTRIAPITADTSGQALRVAAVLNGLAAALAAPRTHVRALDRMRAEDERFGWALWRDDAAEAVDAHTSFHEMVFARTDNRRLRTLASGLMLVVRRIERLTWPDLTQHATQTSHESLISALADADPERADLSARNEWLSLAELAETSLGQAERRSSVAISAR